MKGFCTALVITNRLKPTATKWRLKTQLFFSTAHQYDSVKKQQLPKPPIPSLEETIRKYEGYAQVVATPTEFRQTLKHIDTFLKHEGPLLQQRLVEVAEKVPNWCSHYWINDMYLNVRLALPINSNPAYIFPRQKFETNKDMIRYAALMVCGIYDFKNQIDQRAIPTDKSTGKQGGQPLCMEQYWRTFTSYREPGTPRDIQHTKTHLALQSGQEHITVLCRNQCFEVTTVENGERIPLIHLAKQLQLVVELAEKNKHLSSTPVSYMTTADRDTAAAVQQILQENPINEVSLASIRTSAFVLCLDKEVPNVQPKSEMTFERFSELGSLQLLHGGDLELNGGNRWYDKTNQFVVSEDGMVGMNFEHSVAEGIVLVNMVEHMLKYIDKHKRERDIEYTGVTCDLTPKLLKWETDKVIEEQLQDFKENFSNFMRTLELKVVTYKGYGKSFPKTKNISPDSFIQLILQLTYYRCHGKLVSTYESATTRRFRQGRVDNIRSAHPEAFTWVQIMEDSHANDKIKLNAFSRAIARQQTVMIENVTGYGIDNHLVALKEIAREMGVPTPELFEDEVYRNVFRFPLSTSQVPTHVPETFLCYGPVVDDGYGCSYNPFEDRIIFAISSLNSCSTTNSRLFQSTLTRTLDDMKIFLEGWKYGDK